MKIERDKMKKQKKINKKNTRKYGYIFIKDERFSNPQINVESTCIR